MISRTASGAALFVIATMPSSSWAHSEPPPGPPPPPPEPPATVQVATAPVARFSWLHWWEANREAYLWPLHQRRTEQEGNQASDPELRQEVADALLASMQDPAAGVRAGAARALGRMQWEPAVEVLAKHLAEDRAASVRQAAALGLGLIGTGAAEQVLLETEYPNAAVRATAILALGFIPEPSEHVRQRVGELAQGPASPFGGAATWAATHWTAPAVSPVERLRTDRSPWKASDLLLSLTDTGKLSQMEQAGAVAKGSGVRQVAAWDLLQTAEAETDRAVAAITQTAIDSPQAVSLYADWLEVFHRVWSLDPTPVRPDDHPVNTRSHITDGFAQQLQQRLRVSGVIALQSLRDPRVERVLLDISAERDMTYNRLPRSLAVLGLGFQRTPRALDRLETVLDLRRTGPGQAGREDPERAFAALAVGLYARADDSEPQASDPPQLERAMQRLLKTASDGRETLEVRCAALVGLGLTQRTLLLKPLAELDGGLGNTDQDRLLLSHMLLARAMLGDMAVLEQGPRLLALPAARDATIDILTRRAVVLALGLSNSDAAIPLLVQAWHERFYVNREVVFALSFLRPAGIVHHVLPALKEAQNPLEREYMTMVLGQLMDLRRPSPLAEGFLIDCNFALPTRLKLPFMQLANPFLIQWLLPEVEVVWH